MKHDQFKGIDASALIDDEFRGLLADIKRLSVELIDNALIGFGTMENIEKQNPKLFAFIKASEHSIVEIEAFEAGLIINPFDIWNLPNNWFKRYNEYKKQGIQ